MPKLTVKITVALVVALVWLMLAACVYQETTCEPLDPSTTLCKPSDGEPPFKDIPLTTAEAIRKGFPVYLPSSEIIESLKLGTPPEITMKYWDDGCSYLAMDYYLNAKEARIFGVKISNGCASPHLGTPIEEVELSWANSGFLDIRSKDPLMGTFSEPRNLYVYQVWASESISTTLEFLESMEYVNEGPPYTQAD